MRLIDADALKARWYEINDIDETDRGARFVGYTEIARLIDNAPTIDAVEVVRCEDCKWYDYHAENNQFCIMWRSVHIKPDTDFCSYGERNEE